MSEWDDLFAMAAGHQAISSPSSSLQTSQRTCLDHQNSQKTRKRKRKRSPTNGTDDGFSRMLADRMSLRTAWPQWLRLGPLHVLGNQCPGWEAVSDAKKSLPRGRERCRHCHRSPLHHRVQVVLPGGNLSTAFSIFGNIRNIRCCASILVSTNSEEVSLLRKAIRKEVTALRGCTQSLTSTIPAGEGSLLAAKCTALEESSNAVFIFRKEKVKHESEPFLEANIRLIMACDAVYYRLYYLQITKALPVCTLKDGCAFVPHPSDYFLPPYLSWDVLQGRKSLHECLRAIRRDLKEGGIEHSLGSILLERYGVDDPVQEKENDNPLAALHYNRFTETVALFYSSGWIHCNQVQRQAAKALETVSCNRLNILDVHETPAPGILMEWRDSGRDFLCNLYAYASFPPCTVQRIQKILEQYNIEDGLVELGAGTGYVARLFQDAGIRVKAWDSLPTQDTSTMNEYHGCTPPFSHVREGNVKTLQRHFQSTSRTENVALLLCYPPPETSMAKDALQTFLDAGGRLLVHIGEFCGLTGSREFETLLTASFECLQRIPCLTWGTDASEVTFWKRVHGNDNPYNSSSPSRLLLPCCQCRQRPSVKRCRLDRFLVYCGRECFLAHKHARTIHLTLHMISLGDTVLDYNDKNHFVNIESAETKKTPHRTEIATQTSSSRRKRRRKKRNTWE